MKIMRELARKYGDIDPTDDAAICAFFKDTLPKLPKVTMLKMLDELLEADKNDQDDGLPRTYCQDFDIPKLSESPEAY